MVFLRKPSAGVVERFLKGQAALPLTYAPVGATAGEPPAGYVVDRTRIRLGKGASVFDAARDALHRWDQFALGWVRAWPPTAPIRPGAVVAVAGRAAGLWWLNACRIVHLIDEEGPVCRFGFAYGTLPGHAERGEERFLIEWDRSDDGVWFDILAFSRPNHILARLGRPVVRRLQQRFGRDSAQAMFRAVNGSAPAPAVWQDAG